MDIHSSEPVVNMPTLVFQFREMCDLLMNPEC